MNTVVSVMSAVSRSVKVFAVWVVCDLTLTLSGRRALILSLASHFKSGHGSLLHTIDTQKDVSDVVLL